VHIPGDLLDLREPFSWLTFTLPVMSSTDVSECWVLMSIVAVAPGPGSHRRGGK
jgi:hypothetical protein